MIEKELLDKIKKKLKEIKKIRNLNSRDFRFKNWYASTVNLLKTLPSDFIADTSDFRRLAFTDTKYHRGNRLYNPEDDTRYRKDLDSATEILKKITLEKKELKHKKVTRSMKKAAAKKVVKTGRRRPSKVGKSTTGKKPDRKVETKKSKSMPKKPPALKTKTKKIKKK